MPVAWRLWELVCISSSCTCVALSGIWGTTSREARWGEEFMFMASQWSSPKLNMWLAHIRGDWQTHSTPFAACTHWHYVVWPQYYFNISTECMNSKRVAYQAWVVLDNCMKGVYMDGHGQENVVESHNKVLFLWWLDLKLEWQNLRAQSWSKLSIFSKMGQKGCLLYIIMNVAFMLTMRLRVSGKCNF